MSIDGPLGRTFALQWWIMPVHNTLQVPLRNVMVHIFSPLAGGIRVIGRGRLILTLAAALALAGCASVPPPDSAMNVAQGQLQTARDAQAADYAPVDLGFAQDKFQQAQQAMAKRDYDKALTLAEESRADAELATAKARLAAERAQIEDKMARNDALRARGNHEDAAAAPASVASPAIAPEQPADMPAPPASVLAPAATPEGFQSVPAPATSATVDGGQS